MWFRNLFLFRFNPQTLGIPAELLESALDGQRLRDVGAIELSTTGFVSPFGRGSDVLVHAVGDFALFALGTQERLLPSGVINEELATRIEEIADKTGRKPGGRERKRLKEEIITDLLPRAFVRESRMYAYFDLARGWLVVNTASRKAAESVVMGVRDALGSFPCVPMAPEESPRVLMTNWLTNGSDDGWLPPGLTLGDECELRDPVEGGGIVRCKHQELGTDEVREHLKSGKQVYRTAFTFNDRISFVLSEDLVVRALRFLDVVQDELGDEGHESALAELDAIFALQTLELRELLGWLDDTFNVSASPSLKLDGGDAPKHMRDAENRNESDMEPTAQAEPEPRDVLFDNAAMIVRVERRAGISLLQNKLAVGYNRAARVLEQLEQAGIVSAPAANGERTVLETTA